MNASSWIQDSRVCSRFVRIRGLASAGKPGLSAKGPSVSPAALSVDDPVHPCTCTSPGMCPRGQVRETPPCPRSRTAQGRQDGTGSSSPRRGTDPSHFRRAARRCAASGRTFRRGATGASPDQMGFRTVEATGRWAVGGRASAGPGKGVGTTETEAGSLRARRVPRDTLPSAPGSSHNHVPAGTSLL